MALAASPSPGLAVGAAVNSAVYVLGLRVLLAGLTPAAVGHSWALGTCVYAAFGAGGYTLVCMYFILGSAVGTLYPNSRLPASHPSHPSFICQRRLHSEIL